MAVDWRELIAYPLKNEVTKSTDKLCMLLRQVKCILSAGAEVICAETVMNPVQLYNAEQIPEMEDELKFLFTIRSVHLLI